MSLFFHFQHTPNIFFNNFKGEGAGGVGGESEGSLGLGLGVNLGKF